MQDVNAHSSAIFKPSFACFPLLATHAQMFNNYSALCYTAFIEGEVYGFTDSCMTEVTYAGRWDAFGPFSSPLDSSSRFRLKCRVFRLMVEVYPQLYLHDRLVFKQRHASPIVSKANEPLTFA